MIAQQIILLKHSKLTDKTKKIIYQLILAKKLKFGLHINKITC